MPESYYDKDVKCPFYCKTMANKIVCEGVINNSTLHTVFTDDKDRRKYLQGVCDSLKGHKVCPMYKMLYQVCEDNNE